MALRRVIFLSQLLVGAASAQSALCDLSAYKPADGLRAEHRDGALHVSWLGERGDQLRAAFAIRDAQPVIVEVGIHARGGNRITLGRNLTPEFEVTSGVRRISEQQLAPLRALKIEITSAVIEREKWNVFWDAPLRVPGSPRVNPGLPRRPEEIRRARAKFVTNECAVKTDGARLEIEFPGLDLGIFSGRLRYTVYRGSNLLRQEAIARTDEPSVAYKYLSGLRGFTIGPDTRVVWRDTARAWQHYAFGGQANREAVALRARNRMGLVETGGGTLAFFPSPHKFFFAREIELNLGYVYYRKDNDTAFAVGTRQGDREEEYQASGVSDEVWRRRSSQARSFVDNFALYNAPPGTWQRMAAYFYLSAEGSGPTQQRVLAYTHDDTYKGVPGYKVAISHFHTHFNEELTDAGTIDHEPAWLPVLRALGVNIAMMSDFHGDGHARDPGPLRFKDQQVYFDGCRRFSDRDFLLIPGEEPNGYFGGHYTMVFPRPVYWSLVRAPGLPVIDQDPAYGKVYRVGSAADELEMLRQEQGFVWQSHPRTKGSTGYPDAIRDSAQFQSDRFLGGSFQSLPVDLSESRLCEQRCFSTLDDMNNWAEAKYLIAEGDTYRKFPDDETYPHLMVNYVKLDRVPRFDEDWSPILKAMRGGDFFVTSGEVLFRGWSLEGTRAKRTYTADVEWTFPLEFAELVWGDGMTTHRKVVPMSALGPFGTQRFQVPFDARGIKWVRFAVWDSAGNGAFTQPTHLE
jgi:hypothetical protein